MWTMVGPQVYMTNMTNKSCNILPLPGAYCLLSSASKKETNNVEEIVPLLVLLHSVTGYHQYRSLHISNIQCFTQVYVFM